VLDYKLCHKNAQGSRRIAPQIFNLGTDGGKIEISSKLSMSKPYNFAVSFIFSSS
jgi:hypothetical protein